jgi:hypothetical protein
MPLGLGSALSILRLGTLCLYIVSVPPSFGRPSVLESRRSFRIDGERRVSSRADNRASRLRLGTLFDLDTTGEGDFVRSSGGAAGRSFFSRGSERGVFR